MPSEHPTIFNAAEIVWIIDVEKESVPVRGNAMVSRSASENRACEDKILRRLRRGDVWAWASVTVTGVYRGVLTASDSIGACSYANEADFKQPGGYYDDLREIITDELRKQYDRLTAP